MKKKALFVVLIGMMVLGVTFASAPAHARSFGKSFVRGLAGGMGAYTGVYVADSVLGGGLLGGGRYGGGYGGGYGYGYQRPMYYQPEPVYQSAPVYYRPQAQQGACQVKPQAIFDINGVKIGDAVVSSCAHINSYNPPY